MPDLRECLGSADHYTGLRENWDYGPIYCSEVTGKLVVKIVGVSADLIRPLKWDTPTIVDGAALSQGQFKAHNWREV